MCRSPACTRLVDERIVGRDGPIVAEAYGLPGVVIRIGGPEDVGTGAGSADRHVQHAIASEPDSRRLGARRARLEDVLHVNERRAIPRATHQRCRASHCRRTARGGRRIRVGHGLVIRDIDPLVLREARVEDDVHQTLQSLRVHARSTRHRIRVEHAVSNDAETAGTLRHEDVAVGQECDRPRLLKLRHDDDAQIAMCGYRGLNDEWTVAEHRVRPLDRRRADAALSGWDLRVQALGTLAATSTTCALLLSLSSCSLRRLLGVTGDARDERRCRREPRNSPPE